MSRYYSSSDSSSSSESSSDSDNSCIFCKLIDCKCNNKLGITRADTDSDSSTASKNWKSRVLPTPTADLTKAIVRNLNGKIDKLFSKTKSMKKTIAKLTKEIEELKNQTSVNSTSIAMQRLRMYNL